MVSSNPYHPLQPTAGDYSHMYGESWMVDGEASVMMMAMISSKSPTQHGARTEFLVAELGFLSVAAKQNSLWKTSNPPVFLGHGASNSPKERSRWSRRRPHHPQSQPSLARAWAKCGPLVGLLRSVFWLRGSSGKI